MAPKVPSVISCSSIELLEHELDTVRSALELTESEDTWEKINNALLRLNAVVVGSADDYPNQIIAACKKFVRPIINSLNSERSRLSGCATDLMTNLAANLQRPFEPLIPLFVPALLTLASRSNKIFVGRSKNCLLVIVEHCGSPAIIPLLRHSISDKSVTLRQTTIDVVVVCLNSFNPPDLESKSRVEDIEAIIRATARDSNADVRKSSRKAFEAYKILFPARLDAFIAPLTPTMKKYLDIKSTNRRKPLLLSSSASAPSVPSAVQSNDALSRSHAAPQGHGKSNSTSSGTTSSGTTFTRVERSTKAAKPAFSGESSKPPSSKPTSTGPPTDCELMPPPQPPQKSSSGPVRPPPGMRPAMPATSAGVSSRPLPGRQASRMNLKTLTQAGMDITKSQPVTHAVEHREKSSAPAARPAATEHPEPTVKPAEADLLTKRSTGGPRRVPRPENVVAPSKTTRAVSVPPPTTQKPAEELRVSAKVEAKERPTSSSASSMATTHERKPVFTRPPEPVAPTETRVGEKEKGRVKELVRDFEVPLYDGEEREREPRRRSESRSEEFRPSSRAERGHERTVSQNQEVRSRPASRADGEVLQRPPSRAERPPSRMDGEAPFRPESRTGVKRPESRTEQAEMKVAKAERKVAEEVNSQGQQDGPQKAVDSEARARREERRRRRAQAEQAALEAQAQSDALAQARREEKRRRREHAAAQAALAQQNQNPPQAEAVADPAVAARREEKKRRRELAALQQQQQQQAKLQSQGQGETAANPAAAAKLEERRRRRGEHDAARAAGKRPKDERAVQEKPGNERRNEANPAMQQELNDMQAEARKATKQLKLAALATEHEVDEDAQKARVRAKEVEVQPPPVTECRSLDLVPPIEQPAGGPSNSVSPYIEEKVDGAAAIAARASHCEGAHQQEFARCKTPPMPVARVAYGDLKIRPLAIHKVALETPLPPSPPPFETPAPLRKAVASWKYQVPATPISRLLDTIQRGFDPDFSVIDGESEGDLGFSSVPQEAQGDGGEHDHQNAPTDNTEVEETMGDDQTQAVFVDTRPRKLKTSHAKDKEKEKHGPGDTEGRPPLKAQNR